MAYFIAAYNKHLQMTFINGKKTDNAPNSKKYLNIIILTCIIMRILSYSLDLALLTRIKADIVPAIFTEHQFGLIRKRLSGGKLTDSEKNEFSRSVSRKMKAIYQLTGKESKNIFIQGKEHILPGRLSQAERILARFSRKFKNRQVIISGSFLYSKKYNDIDIFILSKYEKEDYKSGPYHINYLGEDSRSSLFFHSLARLSVSNKKIEALPIDEKGLIDKLISVFQELYDDIDKKRSGVKSTLREFLLLASYLSNQALPDSRQLGIEVKKVLSLKNPNEIIKNIFINAAALHPETKSVSRAIRQMLSSYDELMKEYPSHKGYYLGISSAFKKVVELAA